MTAGRKPLPAAQVVEDTTDHAALEQANQAATELVLHEVQQSQRRHQLAHSLDYESAYDRERVVQEFRFYAGTAAEAMLEAGKRLILLKENEPHGEFQSIVTQRLGLSDRTARVMMQAAAKYLLNPVLEQKRQALAGLGKTKLIELLAEPDEDIAALVEGGTIAGKTLEDIDAMSSRELKAALRKAREGLEDKDRVLKDYADKIREKDEQLARPWRPSEDSIARNAEEQAALDELAKATTAAELGFIRLAAVVGPLAAEGHEAIRERALQAVQYLVTRMRQTVLEHGLDVEVSDDALGVRPSWLADFEQEEAGAANDEKSR